MKMAGDNFGDNERGGNYDANANDAGISHYLSSSQTQVSPAELPERFRAGRESLPVVTLAYSPSESDSVFEMLTYTLSPVTSFSDFTAFWYCSFIGFFKFRFASRLVTKLLAKVYACLRRNSRRKFAPV